MLERRRRVSPNSVHVSGPNCFAFYAFRFAIPFSFLDVVDHRFSRGYNARFDLVKDHGRVDPWKDEATSKEEIKIGCYCYYCPSFLFLQKNTQLLRRASFSAKVIGCAIKF